MSVPAAFHAGQTGVLPLAEGLDAFAARVLLADAAERTLDVQYYIWRADTSGLLLLQALHRAADRGVRVRLLLDDNNTTGLDDCLAALDAHPRAEVRLFNPFRQRRWRMLGYLVDFARLNRRMHNKSFTVDDQVTIVGGRNVGDEYFDASDETRFVDLDVLAVGAVVPDVTADFERYWACASAHPLSAVVPVAAPGALEALEARTAAVETGPAAQDYVEALLDSPLVADLVAGQLALDWTSAQLLSDDPAKGLGRAAAATLLPRRIAEALRGAERELNLVSPYFVPGRGGVAALASVPWWRCTPATRATGARCCAPACACSR
ncbi:phospholipase D-like domain-containing protein [Piscinibacter sakaiensis]|uniref:phospholipase D-like domain-containing protein n=1 Tax=Piscinibacter sakaiensis TaxID=1547922 RepID=UPI003727E086